MFLCAVIFCLCVLTTVLTAVKMLSFPCLPCGQYLADNIITATKLLKMLSTNVQGLKNMNFVLSHFFMKTVMVNLIKEENFEQKF